jgi:phospholipid/cholesterol/gamma-HCH transport system substrate-binding protein
MDLTYKQEVGVGALVLAGLVLFVVGLFWFSGRSIGHKGVSVDVVFDNALGLKAGDPVLTSGVKVGRVAKVNLGESVGRVVVTLELSGDLRIRPRSGATASISSLDFFGNKVIDYWPGAATDTLLPANMNIRGINPEELMAKLSGVATRASTLLGNATGLVNDQLATDIHNTLIATQRGMAALTDATKGPLVNQSTQTLVSLQRVMSRLDTLLGNANVKATGLRVDTLTANLQRLTGQLAQSTETLNQLMTKINRGEGTLGKLATDSTMYHDLHETLTALSKLLDDLRERPGRYVTVKIF